MAKTDIDYMFIAKGKPYYFKTFPMAVSSAKNIAYRVYKNEVCIVEVITTNNFKTYRNVAYIRSRGASRFHDKNLWQELKLAENGRKI